MGFGNEHCKEIVENLCKYCGQTFIMNKRSFANHVRWCKANPRYEEIRTSTIEKILQKSIQYRDLHFKTYTCSCEICNSQYEIQTTDLAYNNGKYKKTCSDSCAKKLTALHTNLEEKRKKISIALGGIVKSREVSKICMCCGKSFITNKKTQKYCNKKCASHYRAIENIKNCPSYKDQLKFYRLLCLFLFALNDYPNEFDFSLIEMYGWYKAKNHGDNLNGVSRDHIYSCKTAFSNGIDPYLISHPANCQLLRHKENVKKYSDCNISIEQLKEKVELWNTKYGIYPNKINYTLLEKIGIKINN